MGKLFHLLIYLFGAAQKDTLRVCESESESESACERARGARDKVLSGNESASKCQ